jgi:MATE family multidrug resistance protein
LAAVISLVFFFGAEAIYHLMHTDPLVHAAGVTAFRMNAWFQIPLAVSIIYVFALRGAGDTRSPLLINVFGVVGVRVPLAYLFGIVYGWGLLGAWIGMAADVTVRAVLVGIRYARGRWTSTRV